MTDDELNLTMREWELPRLNAAAGIDERWLHAFVACRFAEVLAQMAVREPLRRLTPADRAWVRRHTEQLVADTVDRFDLIMVAGQALCMAYDKVGEQAYDLAHTQPRP